MFHSGPTLVAIAVTCALAGTAQAATSAVHVCPTCALNTIQEGIDAANSGDIVRIDPGVYVENISVSGKSLTLVAASAAAVTEIRGTGTDSTVTLGETVTSGSPLPVTIDGLTISNGNGNTNTNFSGGGINVLAGALLHLKNSIVQNSSAAVGGGISLMGGNFGPNSKSSIENSAIANNKANRGGGIYVGPTAILTVSGTTITGNATVLNAKSAPGGGIFTEGGAQISLDRVTVAHNTGFSGVGVYVEVSSTATITRSTLTENAVADSCSQPASICPPTQGIGLYSAGNLTVADSTISHNSGKSVNGVFGGGIYLLPSGNASIDQTVVGFNDTRAGAGPSQGSTFLGEGGGIFIAGRDGNANSVAPIALSDTYIINNNATDALGLFNDGAHQLKTNALTIKDNTGTP
jgi:hypothetical protein